MLRFETLCECFSFEKFRGMIYVTIVCIYIPGNQDIQVMIIGVRLQPKIKFIENQPTSKVLRITNLVILVTRTN